MTGCDYGPGPYECYGTRNGVQHCCKNCMTKQTPENCDEQYKQSICYSYLCGPMKKKVAQNKTLLKEYGELCKKGLVKEILG